MGGTTVADKKNTKPSEQDDRRARLLALSKEIPIVQVEDYVKDTGRIPSGSLSLDMAIGGGYPRGAIIDTFGGESAGKSLLSILAMAQVQKSGGIVALWDAERSYSKGTDWLKTNGVNPNDIVWLSPPANQGAEWGFQHVERLIDEGLVDLVVIDSIPALVPQDALDKEMTENEMLGRRASIVTRFCNRMFNKLDSKKTTIMFINQVRANIVSGPAAAFAPKTKETSNYGLKHASSLRLQVSKVTKPKIVNGLPYSHRVKVVAVKNKVSAPYRSAEFEITYTAGVDTAGEVADILISAGEAEKSGSWIKYDGEKYQGRDGFAAAIRDPKMFDKALKKAQSLATKVNAFGVQAEDDEKLTIGEGDGE